VVEVEELLFRVRIPTKPAMHSNMKPATHTDLKPATHTDLKPATWCVLPRIEVMMFGLARLVKPGWVLASAN
jgi:hypothetical protein